MNITIIGNGAMGLLFYSQLRSHHTVRLVCRKSLPAKSILAVTNLQGLSIEYPLISATKKFIQTSDCLIFCVKSYDVLAALKSTVANIKANTPIVLMHNGMGVSEALAQNLQLTNPIYTMLTTQACRKTTHAHIFHTGVGKTQLGLSNDIAATAQQQQLFKQLAKSIAGLSLSESIKTQQWQKLAINAVINPLTALFDVANGALAGSKFTNQIDSIIEEVISVAKCEQIYLDKMTLLKTIYQVIESTKQNSSSMREDVRRGKLTEIDFINGYINKLGQQHHVPTPKNADLCKQLLSSNKVTN